MSLRLRPLLALTAAAALTAGTVAATARTTPPDVAALAAYAALHGSLGHAGLAPAPPAYTAPGMGPTPQAPCDPGSRPETGRQGRVSPADYTSGRAAKGFTCNVTDIGHEGDSGGFQVHRYVDKAGHECGFYDGTLLFPTNEPDSPGGVVVLDMSNPAKPVRTTVLQTLAMKTPHESFRLNTKRGLLAAVAGSPVTQVGAVDVYDVSQDCRKPALQATTPLGILGHEGAFSPDGNTYWASTTADRGLTAIDLTNPGVPTILWRSEEFAQHGLSISDDGKRAYLADVVSDRGYTQNYYSEITNGGGGMRILDISQIQSRALAPQVTELGYVTWPEVTIPQSTIPVTIKGHKYVVEFDEYDSDVTSYSPDENVGGVRIIDIGDEKHPKVVSRMRLAVWERTARKDQADDPGASSGTQGYAAHYCAVPQRIEPGIVACSTIASGLRVFDIRNPLRPREVGYANHPTSGGGYAMSAPAFDPVTHDVWYADGNSGFWVERLNPTAWPR
ncbi:MAG: hypothetical protein QOJ79_3580 [Actinomycetota bacterium]|jgi:hypothetical protein|nr:hypothetical protein [Actinomycetota bacterium]